MKIGLSTVHFTIAPLSFPMPSKIGSCSNLLYCKEVLLQLLLLLRSCFFWLMFTFTIFVSMELLQQISLSLRTYGSWYLLNISDLLTSNFKFVFSLSLFSLTRIAGPPRLSTIESSSVKTETDSSTTMPPLIDLFRDISSNNVLDLSVIYELFEFV